MNKLPEDIKKKIRCLQIRTRRILNGTLIGDHSTSVKGTGHEFDQLRDYQMGDDVRFVDWKSSARTGKILVKQYFEERNRDIILVVDLSSSMLFSSVNFNKKDIALQIAYVLFMVCQYSKDNVGILLFSDKIIEYIRPSQGKIHISNLIEKYLKVKFRIRKPILM